ncbi:MAG TPA: hypothetical protein VGI42_04025 [Chthoniobacterales bacterium]
MNSPGDRKPEPVDPKVLLQMVELELIQKRAARERAGAQRRSLRTASFLFLFLVIVGTLLGLFYFFSAGPMDAPRAHHGAQPSPPASASPH